jgi:uncharacterized membrane protein
MIREFILAIFNYLNSVIAKEELISLIMASLPVIEARYAIAISYLFLNISLPKIFIFSVIGNMLPVVPLLLFLEPVSNRLRRFTLWRDFFDHLAERARKKGQLVRKYETLGLILFVSIPFPITGAWMGTFAATLFKIKFKFAFLAIFTGIILSSTFVLVLIILGKQVL